MFEKPVLDMLDSLKNFLDFYLCKGGKCHAETEGALADSPTSLTNAQEFQS